MTQTDMLAIRRDDLRSIEARRGPPPGDGGVLLKVDHFALTANNVTYAAFGEKMSYWDFFPLADGWGLTPVWGFATVLESDTAGVLPGERFWGYFPMAGRVRMRPANVTPAGFADEAESRQGLTAGYNSYSRVSADRFRSTAPEAAQMLLRPLFLTAWTIDDYLFDNRQFGAVRAMLSSASSKTAYAAAWLMKRRGAVEVVGLTSPGNLAFVESLGCYDRVLPYEAVTDLPAAEPVTYVDMAANGALRSTVHGHFGEALKLSCAVGATNWDQMLGDQAGLPGPRPLRFFVPSQVGKRMKDWGPAAVQAAILRDWTAFVDRALDPRAPWLTVANGSGIEAVRRAWLDLVDGRADPKVGQVLTLAG